MELYIYHNTNKNTATVRSPHVSFLMRQKPNGSTIMRIQLNFFAYHDYYFPKSIDYLLANFDFKLSYVYYLDRDDFVECEKGFGYNE